MPSPVGSQPQSAPISATEERQRMRLAGVALIGVPLFWVLIFGPLVWWYCRTVKAPGLPFWAAVFSAIMAYLYLMQILHSGAVLDEQWPLERAKRRLRTVVLSFTAAMVIGCVVHVTVGRWTANLMVANVVAFAVCITVLHYGLAVGIDRAESPRFIRGRRMLTLEQARAQGASTAGIPWGGMVVPREDANTHFMIVGAPGSGKTVTMRAIMKAVLPQLGGPDCFGALIYNAKRDVVSRLAGMGLGVTSGQVLILDPFDQRSTAWDIAADITGQNDADEIAAILSPLEEHSTNPYFGGTAQTLLAGIIEAFTRTAPGQWTLRDVVLAATKEDQLRLVLGLTPEGQDLLRAHSQVPLTWDNVLGTLYTKVRPYRVIAALWHRATNRVGLQEWFSGGTVLILGSRERSSEALQTVNRVLFQRLTQMAIDDPDDQDLQRWFFIDEAKDAGNLVGIPSLLTKGRSKGICVVIGFQDIEGMKAVYGDHQAMSLVNLCDQRAVLRVGSPETAHWATEVLGGAEIEDEHVSQSQGSDGGQSISISRHSQMRPTFLTSEIMGLRPPDQTYGPSGIYLARCVDGLFPSRLRWDEMDLPTPDPHTPDVQDRPDSDQELEPWDDTDLKRLGLLQPSVVASPTNAPAAVQPSSPPGSPAASNTPPTGAAAAAAPSPPRAKRKPRAKASPKPSAAPAPASSQLLSGVTKSALSGGKAASPPAVPPGAPQPAPAQPAPQPGPLDDITPDILK